MSGIPTWPTVTGALGSTTTAFGASDWANLISQYFNGTNIALLDANKAPLIGTLTRYVFEKLSLLDTDSSHSVVLSVDDIDTGPTRKIRIRRMNTPYEEDFAVLERLPQQIYSKTIDASQNTITNLPSTSIGTNAVTTAKILDANVTLAKLAADSVDSSKIVAGSIVDSDVNGSAAISWTKLSKSGSVLSDIADVIITTPAQYNIITRNGSSQWVNLAKGSNSTALTVDSSGVLAYTTITNAMLAGSIAYSKLNISNSIVAGDITTDAVTTAKILNSNVTLGKMATDSVDSSKIVDGSIVNVDINSSAGIVTTKLADSANFILKTLDNSFGAHYQDVTKMTAPGNPGANDIRLYVDTSDTHLKIKNNAGTVVDLHATGGSGEVNTLGSVGSGTGTLPATKSGTVLNMKSLLAGTNITLTNNTNDVTIAATGSGGAPTTAQYLTLATDATLTVERVLTAGTNNSFVDGGAGSTLTINVPDGTTSTKGAVELATDGEVAANVVVQGNDSRLVRRNYLADRNKKMFGEFDVADGEWGSGPLLKISADLRAGTGVSAGTDFGYYRYYGTGTVTNTSAGNSTTVPAFQRKWKPYFYALVSCQTNYTNQAIFVGMSSVSGGTELASTTAMLASISGIGLVVRTSTSNFEIAHNDATGTVYDDTGIAKDTASTWRSIEISNPNDDGNWLVNFDEGAYTATITTKVPAQTTAMYANWHTRNNSTVDKYLYIGKMIAELTFP